MLRKGITLAVMFLFIGLSVIPSTGEIAESAHDEGICDIKADVDTAFKTFGGNNSPPYVPSNPYPPGDFPVEIDVNLSWDGGDPDPGDTVTYYVYLGTYCPPPLNGSVGPYPANQTRIQYDPPGVLEFNTIYYWCVAAYDNHDASTAGPIWSFTTQENLPPYEPSDPHPPDGGTNVPVNITLCWEGGDPNPGDSVTYDVYLGFSYPPHNLVSNNQSETCYKPTGLELNKTYYWRIVAWDGQGLSTASPIWNFTTGINHPPSAPIIENENIVMTPIPAPIPPWTHNYTFKATDPDGHDVYYYIDWDDGSCEDWFGPYPSGEEITVSHTWNEKGIFTIRAKAKDIYGAEGPWGYLQIRFSQISQQSSKLLFFQILEQRTSCFPLLERLLSRIVN